jgi:chemotaxis methyl-accepting protein methylase
VSELDIDSKTWTDGPRIFCFVFDSEYRDRLPVKSDSEVVALYDSISNLLDQEMGWGGKYKRFDGYSIFRFLINRGVSIAKATEMIESEKGYERFKKEIAHKAPSKFTMMFHHEWQFETLVSDIIPALVKKGVKKIKIASFGCSTGEEPYSIAIAAKYTLTQLNASDVDFQVLAIDQCPVALSKVIEAQYSRDDITKVQDIQAVPIEFIKDQITEMGDRTATINKDLRDRVVPHQANFAHGDLGIEKAGIDIACGNGFLFYLKNPDQVIEQGILPLLKTDGYFLCDGLHQVCVEGLKKVEGYYRRQQTSALSSGESSIHLEIVQNGKAKII